MARQFINEISDGEPVEEIFVLADKQIRANRNGDGYLLADLRDKTGSLHGLLWNVNEELLSHIDAGDYVKVKGKAQLYNGNMQLIMTRIDTVDSSDLDPEDFQAGTNQDVEKLFEKLQGFLQGISDPSLGQLMQIYLADETLMENLRTAPAGIKAHHAYLGGLIEHIVNLLEAASRIVDLYPSINPDLLTAGIFLHDLGKVRELGYESTFVYTDEGQLIGHLIIGIEMLNEKIQQLTQQGDQIDEETVLRLKHMIASHHGNYEFGSPKLPMTPEAIALHHLDNLDAKVNEYAATIEADPNKKSHWTPYNPRSNRKLFKGISEE